MGIILGKPPGQAVGWTYTGIKSLLASFFLPFQALCDHNLFVLLLFYYFEALYGTQIVPYISFMPVHRYVSTLVAMRAKKKFGTSTSPKNTILSYALSLPIDQTGSFQHLTTLMLCSTIYLYNNNADFNLILIYAYIYVLI